MLTGCHTGLIINRERAGIRRDNKVITEDVRRTGLTTLGTV